MAQVGPELDLVLELQDAVQGRTPRSADNSNSGKRVREQFDHAKVVELDSKLIYDSDLNGHQELPIPGNEMVRQVTYRRPVPA